MTGYGVLSEDSRAVIPVSDSYVAVPSGIPYMIFENFKHFQENCLYRYRYGCRCRQYREDDEGINLPMAFHGGRQSFHRVCQVVADRLDGYAQDAGDFPVWHLLDFGKIENMPAFCGEFPDGCVEPADGVTVVSGFVRQIRYIKFNIGNGFFPHAPAGFFSQYGDGSVQCKPVEPGIHIFDVGQMPACFPDCNKNFTDGIFRQFFPFQNPVCVIVAGGVCSIINCLNAVSLPEAISLI